MASPRVRRTRRHQRHREKVMRAHNGVCHICGQGAADAIDHIVPVSWGGSDDPSNLAPAHTSCNSAKGDAAPPQWTYSRPSMWLPGYGPRAAKRLRAAGASGGPGCWAIGGAVVVALFVGGLVGSIVGSEWVVLGVTAAVAWALIRWMHTRGKPDGAGGVGAGPSPATLGPQELTMPDGSTIRNARGIASMGNMAADLPPEGEQFVWLDFVIEGDNIETLIELLQLSPGYTGYRDGLLQPDGDRLIVNAMARLVADVLASGDGDINAAPIGFVPLDRWRSHPGLGRELTLVQVAIAVNRDGSRSGRIGFIQSVGR